MKIYKPILLTLLCIASSAAGPIGPTTYPFRIKANYVPPHNTDVTTMVFIPT
jgi:hypothetical protein